MRSHFRKCGWVFLPVSIAGWLISVAIAAVAVYTLVSIDKSYNSLFSSLVRFFPYFISYAVVWFWIASNMSDDK